jgi:hypothetical protein
MLTEGITIRKQSRHVGLFVFTCCVSCLAGLLFSAPAATRLESYFLFLLMLH